VRVHFARKHAREFEFARRRFERSEILFDRGERARVVFLGGHFQERGCVRDTARQAIEGINHLLEPRAFATELLRLVGQVPDRRILKFAADFIEPLFLVVVLKGTS
jgi:hypothetical protein